jgi:CRISPR-associated endonuclease/helicase Cas3
VLELREGTPGITVVLEEDADDVRCRRKALARVALPMPPAPKGLDWRSWDRVRGCFVAPTGTIVYDRKRGAEWARG